MRLLLELRPVQRGEMDIAPCGGGTESLFPEVERILREDPEAFPALRHAARSKAITVESYQSMVDFIFCETFTENRQFCRRYYDNKGPPLRELIAGSPQWDFYNRVMLGAIAFAKVAMSRGQPVAWCRYVSVLKKAVRAKTA